MKRFENILCELPALLVAHGVRQIVMSPGSRDAALMQAFDDCDELDTLVSVDERSAAFQALGLAMITNRPVAILCTSGTALLNYGPAVCEAYHRGLPLIVLSADRPREWIDQSDSQTMRQAGALDTFVKKSASIDMTTPIGDDRAWMANRVVNDMLIEAMSPRRGPVHINLYTDGIFPADYRPATSPRVIRPLLPVETLLPDDARAIAMQIMSTPRVLIVAGQLQPSRALNDSLTRLSTLPGVEIVAEAVSNLHVPAMITDADTTIHNHPPTVPDLLITLGGSIITGRLKKFLRLGDIAEHWHVGHEIDTFDTYKSLTRRVEMVPEAFFRSVCAAMRRDMPVSQTDYKAEWRMTSPPSREGWNEAVAVMTILDMAPSQWNLQLSNGTTVRHAMLTDCSRFHRVDCNRGVSGIDGSTSTAVGASLAYDGMTLLVSGDMSARYDIGALFEPHIDARFKMVVINNGGGGIFRNVKSTAPLAGFDRFYVEPQLLPLRDVAESVHFAFFEASNVAELNEVFPAFAAEKARPAMLQINIDVQHDKN